MFSLMGHDSDFSAKPEANLTMTCRLYDLHLKANPQCLRMTNESRHEKRNPYATITSEKLSH